MIERLLIANRGECARRIVHTLRESGKTPIVVYTEDDKNSLHVREAEVAYEIPSYTDIRSIVKVARRSEADAVHPGWGFMSEDPRFPKACEKAGIIFIGPTEDAMSKAGDKKSIKQIAKKLGIPVIASSSRVKQSGILDWASKHGLNDEPDSVPIMLKAARAGGGSGNKVVLYRKDLEKEANKLAENSQRRWGRSRILVESLVRKARHVEVQFYGDQNGNLAHLGTRDCSVQLNHQKVIEEAPAPFLTPEQEKLLVEYALSIGKAVGYSSAGTMEFLITRDREIFLWSLIPESK